MNTDGRDRRGFTLIELLVVIAIIGVLIALLLPAVQAAREAARRAQCVNNLLQLSIAVQNYEAAHEVLPPGVVNPAGPIASTPKGYHFGWMAQILPFIEERAIYNNLNFQLGVYEVPNITARTMVVSTMLCPSDGLPNTSAIAPPGSPEAGSVDAAWPMPGGAGGIAVGMSSYAACHHDVEAPIDITNNGTFFLNSSVRYEDITDGTAKTIFLGEKRRFADLGWASGTSATLRNTGKGPNAFAGGPASGGATPGGAAVPTAETPLAVGSFSSLHPGGANFAFGDGSIRFIKDSIDPEIFRRLGHRADGEMISAESY